jgi:hypothetical protein
MRKELGHTAKFMCKIVLLDNMSGRIVIGQEESTYKPPRSSYLTSMELFFGDLPRPTCILQNPNFGEMGGPCSTNGGEEERL